jgi:uncharacterized phage protein gp47/JayE
VPVFIKINIKITDPVLYPANAPDLIKAALVEFWAQLAAPNDEGTKGFVVGENVIRSRLYTPINTIPGFSIVQLLIGTSAAGVVAQDITIAWDHVGTLAPENITITVDV